MTGAHATLRVSVLLLAAAPAFAQQNVQVEVSEWTLNALLRRIGTLSEAGSYRHFPDVEVVGALDPHRDCSYWGTLECPGPAGSAPGGDAPRVPLALCRIAGPGPESSILLPLRGSVRWQWSVTNARFTARPRSLSFTATVRTRVGDVVATETRTVPVALGFEPGGERVQFTIGMFTVPLTWPSEGGVHTIGQVDVAKLYRIAVPIPRQTFSIAKPAGGEARIVARGIGLTGEFLHERVRAHIDLEFRVE